VNRPGHQRPAVVAGDVLRLRPGDWRYGDGELLLQVERVRDELSRYYEGQWVWVEGYRLDPAASAPRWTQALVRAEALSSTARR